MLDRFHLPVVTFFRIAVGALFACHGAASIFGILGGSHPNGGAIPVGQWPGWWAAAIQLAGGFFVIVGLWTIPAALLCSGSMAYAYFVVHQKQGLLPIENNGEAAAMFALAFLVLAVVGPGRYSIDHLLSTRRVANDAEPAIQSAPLQSAPLQSAQDQSAPEPSTS